MTKTYLVTESNLIVKTYKVEAISEEEALNNFNRDEAEQMSEKCISSDTEEIEEIQLSL